MIKKASLQTRFSNLYTTTNYNHSGQVEAFVVYKRVNQK